MSRFDTQQEASLRYVGEGDADFTRPIRATTEAAAVDLRANIEEEIVIPEGREALIPTGYAVRLPMHFCGLILPRSSIENVIIPNAPGLIDKDYYPNEIKVRLFALSGEVRIRPGDRIAQLLITPPLGFAGAVETGMARTGGFGSTNETEGENEPPREIESDPTSFDDAPDFSNPFSEEESE